MQSNTIDAVLILTPTRFEAEHLFGKRDADSCLIRESLLSVGCNDGKNSYISICGFGLAAAGAGAGYRISQILRHESGVLPVILAGIAGTYNPEKYPVGSVVFASSVRCAGIGAGSGEEHQSADSMGWAQGLPIEGLPVVYDALDLSAPPNPSELTGTFLSVASASGNIAEANARAKQFPEAVGEEMEGFAVGLACRLYRSPLFMIRGISNVAGDRDKSQWKTKEALLAVRSKLDETVNELFGRQG